MSARDESDLAARRQELENRNASLRGSIDTMLSDLRRRTTDLQERQAEAASKSHEVSSEDGMVTATVDASGTLQKLELSPKAFERTSPDRLAQTITSLIREATGTAQQTLHAEFADLADAPDLPNLLDGAPSFQDLLGNSPLFSPPDPASERAERTGGEPPSSGSGGSRRPAPDPDDDMEEESLMDDFSDNRRRRR